eukprot:3519476-Prymnesium_polylepis.1
MAESQSTVPAEADKVDSEADAGPLDQEAVPLEAEVKHLRRELQRERQKTSQLEDKLRRQVKAQELMVSGARSLPDRASALGILLARARRRPACRAVCTLALRRRPHGASNDHNHRKRSAAPAAPLPAHSRCKRSRRRKRSPTG